MVSSSVNDVGSKTPHSSVHLIILPLPMPKSPFLKDSRAFDFTKDPSTYWPFPTSKYVSSLPALFVPITVWQYPYAVVFAPEA